MFRSLVVTRVASLHHRIINAHQQQRQLLDVAAMVVTSSRWFVYFSTSSTSSQDFTMIPFQNNSTIRWLSSSVTQKTMNVHVEESVNNENSDDKENITEPKGEIKAACGPLPNDDDEEEEEQEEMFVDPHESFEHSSREWGGPRRGGRLPEPTRYGDWERNGRCSDFG